MRKAKFSEPVLGILRFTFTIDLNLTNTLDAYLLKYTMFVKTGEMLTSWTTRADGLLDGKRREYKRYRITTVGTHSKQIARAISIGIHMIMVTRFLLIGAGLLTSS